MPRCSFGWVPTSKLHLWRSSTGRFCRCRKFFKSILSYGQPWWDLLAVEEFYSLSCEQRQCSGTRRLATILVQGAGCQQDPLHPGKLQHVLLLHAVTTCCSIVQRGIVYSITALSLSISCSSALGTPGQGLSCPLACSRPKPLPGPQPQAGDGAGHHSV